MEPYDLDPPAQGRGTEVWRRYQRSLRLKQFARDLASWERQGWLDHPHFVEKIAYRRDCLARWEEYLNGAIAPFTGRKPK